MDLIGRVNIARDEMSVHVPFLRFQDELPFQ
jgi:hypothetical protein